MVEKLRESLNLYHMNALRQIAEHLNIDPTKNGPRKSVLIDALYNKICQIAASPAYIESLSQAEHAVLALLLKHGGVSTLSNISLPLMKTGLVYVEGQDSTLNRPRLEDVLLSLLRRGLILNLDELTNTVTRRGLENFKQIGIAPEVSKVLPRDLLTLPTTSASLPVILTPQHVESEDFELCMRRLFFLWIELEHTPLELLKSGGISKRDVRRLAKNLRLHEENDAEHIFWTLAILQALNLLTVTPTMIRAADTDAAKLFWNASPRVQLSTILQSYGNVSTDLPLNLNLLYAYAYYPNISTCPFTEMRSRLLGLLKETADMQWFPFSLFLTFLNGGRSGSLTLTDDTLNSLYANLRWYGENRREELRGVLSQIDQQAALAMLTELRMLGVLELGYARPGGELMALQLSPLVRAHFTDQVYPPSPNKGQVILQPDFQILALGPAPLSVFTNLERFAIREQFSESVVTYRITREGAYQAFRRGESAETICTFLEEATGQPVPQNIARTLEEWGSQYERIVILRNVAVLQTDDAQTLDRLLEDRSLGKLLHRLDEHTAWLPTKNLARFEAYLKQLDMLPAYSQGPAADLPHSLHWEQDKLFTRHPMPSLYVTGTLRRMAIQEGEHWQLTRQSVRAAVAAGMDIPTMIKTLEQMTGTPLTPEWQKRLKAWGSHYGDAQVAAVHLLRLESDEALQELRRSDRRLGRWLHPLPQAPGLAVVDEKHWEELRTLLQECGVEVQATSWW